MKDELVLDKIMIFYKSNYKQFTFGLPISRWPRDAPRQFYMSLRLKNKILLRQIFDSAKRFCFIFMSIEISKQIKSVIL